MGQELLCHCCGSGLGSVCPPTGRQAARPLISVPGRIYAYIPESEISHGGSRNGTEKGGDEDVERLVHWKSLISERNAAGGSVGKTDTGRGFWGAG